LAERLCGCGCKRSLEGRRSDCLYHDDHCRFRVWSREHPQRLATASVKPQTSSSNGRRPSRDGKGARLYLTPDDLQDLMLNGAHLSLPVFEKVKAARDRLDKCAAV
jgi:hypothetical protein